MHLEYEKYIQRKCGNYMVRNDRFNEYVNAYDTLFKILQNSCGYTKEPSEQQLTNQKKNLNSGTPYYKMCTDT